MRLCDWYLFKSDDPANRCPVGPLHDTAIRDPLHCARCEGWTPQGNLPSIDRVTILAREITSLVDRLADDYAWAHSVAFAPTRNGHVAGAGSNGRATHSDPAGNAASDPRRAAVRGYAAIAARLTEQAIRALRLADEAIGDALLAAEPPGPKDHTKAPFHDPATLFPGRPDLAEAHAALARRHARGEGIPT